MAQQVRKLIRTFTGGQITKVASHLLDTPDNASGVTCENVDITAGTLASAKSPRFFDRANGEAVTWFKNYFSFFEKGTAFTDLLKMKIALRPDGLLYYTKDGKEWHKLQVINQPKTAFIEHRADNQYTPINFELSAREKESSIAQFYHEASYYDGSGRWYPKTYVRNYIKARYFDIALPYSQLSTIVKLTVDASIPFNVSKVGSWIGDNAAVYNDALTWQNSERGLDDSNFGPLYSRLCGVSSIKQSSIGLVSEATGTIGYIVVPVIVDEATTTAPLDSNTPLQIASIEEDLYVIATLDGEEIFKEKAKFNKTSRFQSASIKTKDGKVLKVEVRPLKEANILYLLNPLKVGVTKKRLGFVNVSPNMLSGLLSNYLYTNLKLKTLSGRNMSGRRYGSHTCWNTMIDCCCRYSGYKEQRNFIYDEAVLPIDMTDANTEHIIRTMALDTAELSTVNSITTDKVILVNDTPSISTSAFGMLDKPNNISISTALPKLDGIYGEFSYVVTIYDEDSDFETGPSNISGPFKCGYIIDGKEVKDELKLSIELPDLGTYTENLKVRIYRLGGGTTKFRLLKEVSIKDFIADMDYDSRYTFTDNVKSAELGVELITRDNIDVNELTSITNYYGQLFASKDNLVLWSRENRPGYWDASSYMAFDNEVVGCAAAMEGVLVFTSLRTYILIGQGSAMYKQLLSETTGCISRGSICIGGNMVVWQAQTGLILYSGGQLQPLTYQKLAEPLPLITSSFFSNGKYFGITEDGRVLVIDGLNGYAILWYNYGMPIYSGVNVKHEEFLTDGRQLLTLDGEPLPMKWKSQRLATTLGVVKNYKTLIIYCENTRGLQANIYVNDKIATNVSLHDGCNQIKIAQASRLGYFLNIEFVGIGNVIEVQLEDEENQNAI